ncbi:uromodulin-like [Gracilinanus agilis]|uniref:uromodulin-like n=1 Tax=Gracilinanus agilis TaxID=191870 RepID=UPI001CFE8750|nr:uromodulin-like [Gracilinanus agilis]
MSTSATGSPCASDEYLERGCKCNSSYYAHPELNDLTVALSCQPWEMKVSLSQCLLETLGWVQGDAIFPGCSGISEIVQGRRAITFLMKKKEGTCGLKLSTNTSHALYSLKTQLPPAFFGSVAPTGSTAINFACAYPLVVNVSQKEPFKVATSLHAKIHVPGTGDSIITLSIFTDAQYSSLLVDQPVALHAPLYVVLEATNADPERFVLVANAFFASTNASGTSAPETTYYFVKHSCPVSERLLTKLSANGVSLKVKLAFRLFRFFTSDVLYFHSHMTLCDKKGNSSCQPVS